MPHLRLGADAKGWVPLRARVLQKEAGGVAGRVVTDAVC